MAAWDIVGSKLINLVTDFFESGSFSSQINHTHLTLIPKIKNPENPSQFRPIGLCNVSYKVISKIIVARLRPLLINPHQNAFIPKRSIQDNIALGMELFHSIRTSQPGKQPKFS